MNFNTLRYDFDTSCNILIHQYTKRYFLTQFRYKVQNFDTSRYIKIYCDPCQNQFNTTLEACQRSRRFKHFSNSF